MTFLTQRDFFTEIARDHVPGFRSEHQLGYNDDIDTGSSPESVSNVVSGIETFLSAAETMDLVSNNVADDASPAGTGAQTVCIKGLDLNYDEIEEIISLNGLTPVTSVNSYLRIEHFFVILSGSNETNVGTITMDPTSSGSAFRQAVIDSDKGEDGSSCFTIPNNCVGFMSHVNVGVSSREGTSGVKEAIVELQKRLVGESWRTLRLFSTRSNGTSTSPDLSLTVPDAFPAKTDLRWIADADVNNTSVNVLFDMILISTV